MEEDDDLDLDEELDKEIEADDDEEEEEEEENDNDNEEEEEDEEEENEDDETEEMSVGEEGGEATEDDEENQNMDDDTDDIHDDIDDDELDEIDDDNKNDDNDDDDDDNDNDNDAAANIANNEDTKSIDISEDDDMDDDDDMEDDMDDDDMDDGDNSQTIASLGDDADLTEDDGDISQLSEEDDMDLQAALDIDDEEEEEEEEDENGNATETSIVEEESDEDDDEDDEVEEEDEEEDEEDEEEEEEDESQDEEEEDGGDELDVVIKNDRKEKKQQLSSSTMVKGEVEEEKSSSATGNVKVNGITTTTTAGKEDEDVEATEEEKEALETVIQELGEFSKGQIKPQHLVGWKAIFVGFPNQSRNERIIHYINPEGVEYNTRDEVKNYWKHMLEKANQKKEEKEQKKRGRGPARPKSEDDQTSPEAIAKQEKEKQSRLVFYNKAKERYVQADPQTPYMITGTNIKILSFGIVDNRPFYSTPKEVFPIGFRCTRTEYSHIMEQTIQMICSILDGGPEGPVFKVRLVFSGLENSTEFQGRSAQIAWNGALHHICQLEKDYSQIKSRTQDAGTDLSDSYRRRRHTATTPDLMDSAEISLRKEVEALINKKKLIKQEIDKDRVKIGSNGYRRKGIEEEYEDGRKFSELTFFNHQIVSFIEGLPNVEKCEEYKFLESRLRSKERTRLLLQEKIDSKKRKEAHRIENIKRREDEEKRKKELNRRLKEQKHIEKEREKDKRKNLEYERQLEVVENAKSRKLVAEVRKTVNLEMTRKKTKARSSVNLFCEREELDAKTGKHAKITVEDSELSGFDVNVPMPAKKKKNELQLIRFLNPNEDIELHTPDILQLFEYLYTFADLLEYDPIPSLEQLKRAFFVAGCERPSNLTRIPLDRIGKLSAFTNFQNKNIQALNTIAVLCVSQLMPTIMRSLNVDPDIKDMRFPCNALTWPALAKTWLIGVAIQYLGISTPDPARLLRGKGCKNENDINKHERVTLGLLRSRIMHRADKIRKKKNTNIVRLTVPNSIATTFDNFQIYLEAMKHITDDNEKEIECNLSSAKGALCRDNRIINEGILEKIDKIMTVLKASSAQARNDSLTLLKEYQEKLYNTNTVKIPVEIVNLDNDSDDMDVADNTESKMSEPEKPKSKNFDDDSDEDEKNEEDKNKAILLMKNKSETIRRCYKVLQTLQIHDKAKHFNYNLDPADLAEYHEIIKTPISLDDVRHNIENGVYDQSVGNFAADIRRIFNNCSCYNMDGYLIMDDAEKLSAIFERLLLDWVLDPMADDLEHLDFENCNSHTDDAANNDLVIICDRCDANYHLSCLNPPLSVAPEGDWFCDNCIKQRKAREVDPLIGIRFLNYLPDIGVIPGKIFHSVVKEKDLIYKVRFEDAGDLVIDMNRYEIEEIIKSKGIVDVDESIIIDDLKKLIRPEIDVKAFIESTGYCGWGFSGKPIQSLPTFLDSSVSSKIENLTKEDSEFDTICKTIISLDNGTKTTKDWLEAIVGLTTQSCYQPAFTEFLSNKDAECQELVEQALQADNEESESEDEGDSEKVKENHEDTDYYVLPAAVRPGENSNCKIGLKEQALGSLLEDLGDDDEEIEEEVDDSSDDDDDDDEEETESEEEEDEETESEEEEDENDEEAQKESRAARSNRRAQGLSVPVASLSRAVSAEKKTVEKKMGRPPNKKRPEPKDPNKEGEEVEEDEEEYRDLTLKEQLQTHIRVRDQDLFTELLYTTARRQYKGDERTVRIARRTFTKEKETRRLNSGLTFDKNNIELLETHHDKNNEEIERCAYCHYSERGLTSQMVYGETFAEARATMAKRRRLGINRDNKLILWVPVRESWRNNDMDLYEKDSNNWLVNKGSIKVHQYCAEVMQQSRETTRKRNWIRERKEMIDNAASLGRGRTLPLGRDRFGNIYWQFASQIDKLYMQPYDPTKQEDLTEEAPIYTKKRKNIDDSKNKYWVLYETPKEILKIYKYLNPQGVREHNLRLAIMRHYPLVADIVKKENLKKVENGDKLKMETDDDDDKKVERLDSAEDVDEAVENEDIEENINADNNREKAFFAVGDNVMVRKDNSLWTAEITICQFDKIKELWKYRLRYAGWGVKYDEWYYKHSEDGKSIILLELNAQTEKIEEAFKESILEERRPSHQHRNYLLPLHQLRGFQHIDKSKRHRGSRIFDPNFLDNVNNDPFSIVKAALLIVEAGLPYGCVENSATKWGGDAFSRSWFAFVENATTALELMEAELFLEWSISPKWFKTKWAKIWSEAMASRSYALMNATLPSVALRIWTLDKALSYDKQFVEKKEKPPRGKSKANSNSKSSSSKSSKSTNAESVSTTSKKKTSPKASSSKNSTKSKRPSGRRR